MKKVLLSALLASASFPALSADSIDISVIGTISPTACVPSAAGGGVADYGMIKPSELEATGVSVLEVKTLGFSVQCDGVTNVALRANSNRGNASDAGPANDTGASKLTDTTALSSMIANLPYNVSVANPDVMGLGTAPNGADIGGYMMLLPTSLVTLDGEAATKRFYAFGPLTQNTTWNVEGAETNHGGSINSGATFVSYSTDNTDTKPQAFQNLTGTLIIRAYITDQSKLDVTQPINLDGSSTIELYYY
ncbi:DUF1120 domain-containing protein [Providencia manganoxydans]|uniref:DUF1120 domain-containing protein n=1 Tax=Providencia TaxID=586 RepID=UPI00111E5D76|nr:DUF1120 domain-containing protein [Providencia stuartii]